MMKYFARFFAGALAMVAVAPVAASAQGGPWALTVASPAATRITRVATDAGGHTYVAGYVNGAATFGAQPIAVGGGQLSNGFVACLDAQGAVQWMRYLAADGSGMQAVVSGLALDADGNVFFCGSYRSGSLRLGSTTLPQNTASGFDNGLVAKLDPSGKVLWAQPIIEPGNTLQATALDVDAAGTAHVAVSSQNTALASGLGMRTFATTGTPGPRYDFPGVSGTPTANPFGVFGNITDVAVNAATGQVGIVCEFQGTLTLHAAGPAPALAFTSPPEPRKGALLAALTPAGAPQWAQELTSTGYQNGTISSSLNQLNDMAPAGTGFVAVGAYLGAGTLGGAPLPGSAASDNPTAVLARFDAQGQLQWSRAVSGDGTPGSGAVLRAVVTDAAGQMHVAGVFGGHLAANGLGLTSSGNGDALLLRYSDQGQLLGGQRDGSYGIARPYALALDPTGQPVMAGEILGTVSLGGTVLNSGNLANGFVARLARTPLAARAAEETRAALQVYPNPSAGAAALHIGLSPSATPATLRVLNALGQVVRSQPVPAHTALVTVPTAGVVAGRYVVQLISSDGVATRGMVVE
jgi:hypothetical protein